MRKKKAKSLDITKLEKDQLVWSGYFKAYLQFIGRDADNQFMFKAAAGHQYYILNKSDIYESSSLMKELF
jgi:hypothetical protein